jgi:TolB-like protein/DNA-binding SARP family transcriptional activator/Flp pilus assembly protein TadD
MNSPPTFYLRLLGSPSIEAADGAPVSNRVTQRHRVALLALLAVSPGERLSRDKLIALLWPESDADRGRNLLNVATYVLRGALGEDALVSAGDELRLSADIIRSDVADLGAALAAGDDARAVELYRGPFLDGFFLPGAPDFERWVDSERQRLAERFHKALEDLAERAEREGGFGRAVEWWKLRAARDPYDSRVAVRLMQALDASGNRAGALQHASVHQRLLRAEFDMVPPPEVEALAERLRTEPVAQPPASVVKAVRAVSVVESRAAELAPEPPREALTRTHSTNWPRLAAALAILVVALVGTAVLRGRTATPDAGRSIVVLPFVNLSPDTANEYFSDGLTEEIITGLSALRELKVISRTSAMHYKGSDKPVRQIAEELNVGYVLEGSARLNGQRVRISAQLIDARADHHLWAESYESDLRDVFRVQEQIAREVVRGLAVELGDRERTVLVKQGTRDPEAYQLFRRGRFLWNTRTRAGHEQAIEYYRQAIARDSTYADAYAGIAYAYLTEYQLNVSTLPEEELYARIKWAVERALTFDDRSADAHTAFATSLQWQRNWPAAEREFRRAIQLNPSNATARSWLGLLLSGLGKQDESVNESRRAHELDPFDLVPSSNYGWQCYLARDYDCAIQLQLRTIEIAPSWGRAYERLGLVYAQRRMLEQADSALRKAIDLSPERYDFLADVAYVQALRGDTVAAREGLRLAKSQIFEPFNIARAYVGLGERDSAFAWLDRSNWRWPHRAVLSDPALDPLRSDPRFARLAARIAREMGVQ